MPDPMARRDLDERRARHEPRGAGRNARSDLPLVAFPAGPGDSCTRGRTVRVRGGRRATVVRTPTTQSRTPADDPTNPPHPPTRNLDIAAPGPAHRARRRPDSPPRDRRGAAARARRGAARRDRRGARVRRRARPGRRAHRGRDALQPGPGGAAARVLRALRGGQRRRGRLHAGVLRGLPADRPDLASRRARPGRLPPLLDLGRAACRQRRARRRARRRPRLRRGALRRGDGGRRDDRRGASRRADRGGRLPPRLEHGSPARGRVRGAADDVRRAPRDRRGGDHARRAGQDRDRGLRLRRLLERGRPRAPVLHGAVLGGRHALRRRLLLDQPRERRVRGRPRALPDRSSRAARPIARSTATTSPPAASR